MYKNDALVVKIAYTRLTKNCVAISALAERLPTSATLDFPAIISEKLIQIHNWLLILIIALISWIQ